MFSRGGANMNETTALANTLAGSRRRLFVWNPVVVACVALATAGIAVWMLYRTALEQQETRLADLVANRATLIDALGQANQWNEATTLEAISKVQSGTLSLGETGEFVLSKREGDQIRFLLDLRHGGLHSISPVRIAGELAVPSWRALQGESGVTIGLDYRGQNVVAAFRPVGPNWGLVAKIDMSEIRAPFIKAGVVVAGVLVVFVALGSIALRRLSHPVITELAAQNEQLSREVVQRQHSEEIAQDSRKQFASLLESISDGFLAVDRNMVITYFNDAAERVFRRKREDILGRHLFDEAFPEAKGTFFDEQYTVALREGKPRTFEAYFEIEPYRNWYDVRVYPFETGISIYFQVTTERKRAQEDREKLIAKLEAANTELERFTYTVSHDLRSPLVTIKGFVGLLEKDIADGDDDRARDGLARITGAADRMDVLLHELLELSRVGRVTNPPTNLSLREAVDEALSLTEGALVQRGVEVVLPPSLPRVRADRTRLREVLQNLIENAVKYMGDQARPRIEIDAREDRDEVVVRVRDNGMGIEPQYHDRVFHLFDKLDRQTEGTGIGLALVKRIIEVHGGRVWVESEGCGKGACFCFTLPREGSSS